MNDHFGLAATILSCALFAALSTLAGGIFALRLKRYLPLVMAFTGGVLLGVVFFDIFPELFEKIVQTGNNFMPTMFAVVASIIVFHILEKAVLIHSHQEEFYAAHHHPHVGVLSALMLAGHSIMDGFIIGLGFQMSHHIGILSAIAIISHDFTDGMNTVILMLKAGNDKRKSILLLAVDAAAPIIGAGITFLVHIPSQILIILLGIFAGSLLYISLSDILPSAHRDKSSYKLIGLTIAGVGLILGITNLIGV